MIKALTFRRGKIVPFILHNIKMKIRFFKLKNIFNFCTSKKLAKSLKNKMTSIFVTLKLKTTPEKFSVVAH